MEVQEVEVDGRVKELIKKKKKLMREIQSAKKKQIKARIEKRKVNEELRAIRGKKNIFEGVAPEAALRKVRATIEAVTPEEVFPRELERRFDKIDHPKADDEVRKTIDLGRIPEQPIAGGRRGGDDDDTVGGGDDIEEAVYSEEDGVVDLSDE